MIIEKLAQQKRFKRDYYYYDRARDGFKYVLDQVAINNNGVVLLPAFIGWSAREGSGVFDPIIESNVNYDFYTMDKNLHIDIDTLREKFRQNKISIFVIIHYFGHVDINYDKAISIAREYGALIIEDEAHALFTDIIDQKCGRQGDALIYSLHKMLPYPTGGILSLVGNKLVAPPDKSLCLDFFEYDLALIAKLRKRNVEILYNLLSNINGITPLWSKDQTEGESLQTFPVIIEKVDRNILYDRMNNAGFGVVSLYHTMIKNLTLEHYPISHYIAKRIMNLPVHQDVTPEHLEQLCEKLNEYCNE